MNNKKSDKVFIPLTLDRTVKTAVAGGQYAGIAIIGVVAIILQIMLIVIYSEYAHLTFFATGWFLVPLDIALMYILIFILRKAVFHENQLLRAYENNKSNAKTDLSFAWEVYSFSDSRIHYLNGWVAGVLQFQHGYIYDRPAEHESIHRETVQKIIRNLASQGFKITYYNREAKDSNLGPLLQTEKLLQSETGTVRALGADIINYTKAFCSTVASTETETFLVTAPTMYTIQTLDVALEDAINQSKRGLFAFGKRLTTDEIIEFICDYYALGAVDVQSILNRKYSDVDMALVTIEQVTKVHVEKKEESIHEEQLPFEDLFTTEKPAHDEAYETFMRDFLGDVQDDKNSSNKNTSEDSGGILL